MPTGNHHKYNDTERPYLRRNKWGKNLRLKPAAFEYHTVPLRQQLLNKESRNKYINVVLKSEQCNNLCAETDFLTK